MFNLFKAEKISDVPKTTSYSRKVLDEITVYPKISYIEHQKIAKKFGFQVADTPFIHPSEQHTPKHSLAIQC